MSSGLTARWGWPIIEGFPSDSPASGFARADSLAAADTVSAPRPAPQAPRQVPPPPQIVVPRAAPAPIPSITVPRPAPALPTLTVPRAAVAAAAPRANGTGAKSGRPEWSELVASLRKDIERRRVEPPQEKPKPRPIAVEAVPPAPAPAPVPISASVQVPAPVMRRSRRSKPIQDEWGSSIPNSAASQPCWRSSMRSPRAPRKQTSASGHDRAFHLRSTPHHAALPRHRDRRVPDAGAARHLVAAARRAGHVGDAPRPPDRHLLAHGLRRRLAKPRVAVAAALLRHLRGRRPAAAHPRLGRGRDRCLGDRVGRDARPRQAQVPDDGVRARHGDDHVEPACPGAVAAARRLDRGPAAAPPLRLAAAPLLGVGEPARRSLARRAPPRRVALCGAARGHHASPAARRSLPRFVSSRRR